MSYPDGVSLTDSSSYFGSAGDPLPLLLIENRNNCALISLQGGQVLQYQSAGRELLWLSKCAVFQKGLAIRGGIPICAPWFGIHQQEPSKPKHGFVRNELWQINSVERLSDEAVKLVLGFESGEKHLPLYPCPFHLQLSIVVADSLQLELQVVQTDSINIPFSWAFHNYFSVSSLSRIFVEGLAGQNYLDATDRFVSKPQVDVLRFEGEVDRVFNQVAGPLNIFDSHNQNRVWIKSENCPTAIVWNPGISLAAKMSDIGVDQYQDFVCVESGAAFSDQQVLLPDQTYRANMQLSCK